MRWCSLYCVFFGEWGSTAVFEPGWQSSHLGEVHRECFRATSKSFWSTGHRAPSLDDAWHQQGPPQQKICCFSFHVSRIAIASRKNSMNVAEEYVGPIWPGSRLSGKDIHSCIDRAINTSWPRKVTQKMVSNVLLRYCIGNVTQFKATKATRKMIRSWYLNVSQDVPFHFVSFLISGLLRGLRVPISGRPSRSFCADLARFANNSEAKVQSAENPNRRHIGDIV